MTLIMSNTSVLGLDPQPVGILHPGCNHPSRVAQLVLLPDAGEMFELSNLLVGEDVTNPIFQSKDWLLIASHDMHSRCIVSSVTLC